jgi:hypothetical protein
MRDASRANSIMKIAVNQGIADGAAPRYRIIFRIGKGMLNYQEKRTGVRIVPVESKTEFAHVYKMWMIDHHA